MRAPHGHPIPSLNPRKRKSDADDNNTDSPSRDPLPLVDSSLPPCVSSNAPRRPSSTSWLGPASPWSSATTSNPPPDSLSTIAISHSPHGMPAAKRPRIENTPSSPRSRPPRRPEITLPSPMLRSNGRLRDDIIDMGVVPNGPTDISRRRYMRLQRGQVTRMRSRKPSVSSPFRIDPSSAHIPYLLPLINRQTLKELDLDSILRNPQLRHDLLFDASLQFRPTSGRRKRELSERYWLAVLQELETGCTCVSFDVHGQPHPLVCACRQVELPSKTPMLARCSSMNVLTLRTPSRIRSLLSEFLEVLLSVIQPLSSVSGMRVNPDTFTLQMRVHAAQASYLRSIFDPELIEQELRHGVFDPSCLFRSIGDTLKGHCAPMRDRSIDAMVAVAESCARSKAEVVKTVRMCLEILELMKLDIANHQLQALRPYLLRTSGHFELETFCDRTGPSASIQASKQWLQAAHHALLSSEQALAHPLYISPLKYSSLPRNQQVYTATLRAIVDLVFFPPSALSDDVSSTPITPSSQKALPPLPCFPETSYLDSARLVALGTEAADVTAVCMFLLLYRQLVFSNPSKSVMANKIEESDMSKLKAEIRDIAPKRLGYCFTRPEEGDEAKKEWEQWQNVAKAVTLQVAMRAKEAQSRTIASSNTQEVSPFKNCPDERTLRLAESWSDSNLRPDSHLSNMLRTRLRDVVFNTVLTRSYSARDDPCGNLSPINLGSFVATATPSPGTITGLEPLADEIRSLAERLSKLALIHLNAYLPLYEQDAFLGF